MLKFSLTLWIFFYFSILKVSQKSMYGKEKIASVEKESFFPIILVEHISRFFSDPRTLNVILSVAAFLLFQVNIFSSQHFSTIRHSICELNLKKAYEYNNIVPEVFYVFLLKRE